MQVRRPGWEDPLEKEMAAHLCVLAWEIPSTEEPSGLQHMLAKSLQLCPTLCDPMACSPPGSSVHGDSPGKNTGMGCHALLQGIFPTEGLNLCLLCLLHWQAGSLPTEPPGKPESQYMGGHKKVRHNLVIKQQPYAWDCVRGWQYVNSNKQIHFIPFWTSNLIVMVLKLYGLYGTMHCAWHFPCINSFNAHKSLYCIIIFYIDVPTEAQKG